MFGTVVWIRVAVSIGVELGVWAGGEGRVGLQPRAACLLLAAPCTHPLPTPLAPGAGAGD